MSNGHNQRELKLHDLLRNIWLHLTLFITGAGVLVIEIVGTRVLSPFYGSTIFVWSSLIAVTLGFLALGYFASGFIADKFPKGSLLYFLIFLGGALALLLMKLNQPLLVFSDSFGFRMGPLVASLVLFALPLMFLGMAGPFVIRLMAVTLEQTGHVSGRVFGISTVGSLLGALLTGFYLIPNFFISSIFLVCSCTIMTVAIVGLFLERSSWWMIITAGLLMTLTLIMPKVIYQDNAKVSIIHREASFYGDLKVVQMPFARLLLMDDFAQAVFDAENKKVRMSAINEFKRVLSLWPKDSHVLVLGFGGGGAARILDPEPQVDYVEIDPKMVRLAKEFFDFKLDHNDQIIISDARYFLRKTSKTYDVIFLDLYHGNMIPVHTHTEEALNLVKAHLKPGGIVLSNLIGRPDDPLIQTLVKTLHKSFPRVVVGAHKAGFSNLITYAMGEETNNFTFHGPYKEIVVDESLGVVLTDNRNSLDILAINRIKELREMTREVFGYQPFFSM